MSRKKTFAQRAKEISAKYKSVLGENLDANDSLAREALGRELEALKNKQEIYRQKMEADKTNVQRPSFTGEIDESNPWMYVANDVADEYFNNPDNNLILPTGRQVDEIKKERGLEDGGLIPLRNQYPDVPTPTGSVGDDILGAIVNASRNPNTYVYGAQALPAAYNIGRGLFGKADQLNVADYQVPIPEPISAPEIDITEELRSIEGQGVATRRNLRNSAAGQVAAQTATNEAIGGLSERKYNIDSQNEMRADLFNSQSKQRADAFNAQTELSVDQINLANEAAKDNFLSAGLSQLSDVGQSIGRERFYMKALDKQYEQTTKIIDAINNKPIGELPDLTSQMEDVVSPTNRSKLSTISVPDRTFPEKQTSNSIPTVSQEQLDDLNQTINYDTPENIDLEIQNVIDELANTDKSDFKMKSDLYEKLSQLRKQKALSQVSRIKPVDMNRESVYNNLP